MKLATFTLGSGPRLGLVLDDGLVNLSARLSDLPTDMIGLITHWDGWRERVAALQQASVDHALATVKLLAPVPRPGKILGIGLNYTDHVSEAAAVGFTRPAHQMWFSKPATAVTGPFDPIERPQVSNALDYEVEMVFVVGRRARHLSPEAAESAIFGYCVGNDVSVRDWQTHTSQVMMGKCFNTHAPFGPWIVTSDEVDAKALDIRLTVNGECRQSSNTRHMIFDCAAQLSYLSQAMTMEPGDVIFTGTPSGVGALMNPPAWLKPGDRVRVEIAGLGAIENEVVQESSAL